MPQRKDIQLDESNFASFIGRVRRPSPGVPAGSLVKMTKDDDHGWHLFVTTSDADEANRWDVWADTWSDVLEWLAEWNVEAIS
jgi:hypothetical protein